MFRKVLKFAGIAVVSSMFLASSLQAKTVRWRLAMSWPSTLTPLASHQSKWLKWLKK